MRSRNTLSVSKTEKTLIAFGGGYKAAAALFCFLTVSRGFSVYDIAGVLLALFLSVSLLPLIYDKIHNSPSISTGRFHIPLAVSAVCGAVFSVIYFSSDTWFAGMSDTAALVIRTVSMPAAALSVLIFLSVSDSIRSRVNFYKSKCGRVFSPVILAVFSAAIVTSYFLAKEFSPFSPEAFASQIAGILMLISGLCLYFGSSAHIPGFIRLEVPQKLKPGRCYAKIFKPFRQLKRVADASCYVFCHTAVILFALCSEFLRSFIHVEFWASFLPPSVFIISFLLCSVLSGKKMNAKGSLISCIISVLSIVTAAGGVIICAYISLDGITGTAVYTAAYFFIGCAGGLMNSVRAYRTREITLNSGAPRGIADNFYNLMLVISFAAACVIALPVFFTAAAVVPFIAAGAAAVFQLIFAVTAYRAGGLTMQSVGLFDAKEIMRSIENKKTDDEKLAELIAELDRTEADGD